MSRLLASRLLAAVMRPAIRIQASRSPAMFVCSAKSQLGSSMRFMASWGDEETVDRKDIEFRVLKSISAHDKISEGQVSLESHLYNDLGLDSLDQVEIIVGIEDEFKLEIEDINSEKLLSVKDIVEFLVNYYENKAPLLKNPGHAFPKVEFGEADK